jgi:hypothetical protein
MSNQAAYQELRAGYVRRLAIHDQAASRLTEQCVQDAGMSADINNMAEAFIADPKSVLLLDPRQQALLAMLAHAGMTALMLNVIDRRMELESK